MPVFEITSPDGRTFEVTAPDGATKEQALAYAQQNYQPAPEQPTAPTKPKTLMSSAGDLLAGGVRGAGSIGATILAPYDMAKDAIAGKGVSLESNRQRRNDMDATLRDFGADTDSAAYGVGKLGAEIAGTAGAGNLLARPVQALSATRFGAGIEPVIDGVAAGLRSGGFRVGPLAGTGASIPTRLATGAVSGGVQAGLINPESAPAGAAIGGAFPVAARGVAQGSQALGSLVRGGASKAQAVTPEFLNSARQAIDSGYVIPPATVKPTFTNRALESVSGKQATQQLASVQNAEVSRQYVKQALGLADDVPLNRQTLEGIRKEAGVAYQAIADLPPLPARQGSTLMNTKAQDAINPRVMIEELKQARNDAQTYFTSYNRSASPEHLKMAKAAESLATRLETDLEKYARSRGATHLLPDLREARRRIAQTYTVERALNEATGSIDATVLGKLFKKGKPLSGGLEKVGQFGAGFPSVAKLPEKIGSPDTHNLRTVGSLMMGGIGGIGAGPVGLLAGGIPYVAPPVARSIMFSRPMQQGLLSGPVNPEAMGMLTQGARLAPGLLAQ